MDSSSPSSRWKILMNCLERISLESGHRRWPEPPDNNTRFIILLLPFNKKGRGPARTHDLFKSFIFSALHASGCSGSPRRTGADRLPARSCRSSPDWFIRKTHRFARSSTYRNSRSGEPSPQQVTLGRFCSLASWKRRISAGTTWLWVG